MVYGSYIATYIYARLIKTHSSLPTELRLRSSDPASLKKVVVLTRESGLPGVFISQMSDDDYWIICKGSEEEVEELRSILESEGAFELLEMKRFNRLKYFEETLHLRKHLERYLSSLLVAAFAFLIIFASLFPTYGPEVARAKILAELAYLFLAMGISIQILSHILRRYWTRSEDYILKERFETDP